MAIPKTKPYIQENQNLENKEKPTQNANFKSETIRNDKDVKNKDIQTDNEYVYKETTLRLKGALERIYRVSLDVFHMIMLLTLRNRFMGGMQKVMDKYKVYYYME